MKWCGVSVIFVTIAAILILSDHSIATNSTWGYRGPYDVLLHRELVVKSSSWMQVIKRNVIFPPPGFINYRNISFISAIDHKKKNGGYAALTKGGIGYRNVTILLTSDRSHGLNYTVEIYGR